MTILIMLLGFSGAAFGFKLMTNDIPNMTKQFNVKYRLQ